MKTRRFQNEYAADGKEQRLRVRAEAGHRCIRCGHPFESGKHGRGEWSPCDERCTHAGPTRHSDSGKWEDFPSTGVAIKKGFLLEARWRVLTVHHFDGNKANDVWWNCLPLCQRCHLTIQTKVDPRIPWFLEHSEWIRPYVAGFYAHKYEGKIITREEAMACLDELLAYEFKGA